VARFVACPAVDLEARNQFNDNPSGDAIMYTPHVGRWLSEDPSGFVDWPNQYLYVKNNPVNQVDPSGEEPSVKNGGNQDCQIAIHCWQVLDPIFGFALQKHCGLTVNAPSLGGTKWVDGGPTGDLPNFGNILIGWQPPNTFPGKPNATYTPPGLVQTPFAPYPISVCNCLKDYADNFTTKKEDYELLSQNSNWALRCISTKCGVNVPYPPSKPLGWECEKCIEEKPSTSQPVPCCVLHGPCPCPK
jgi:hypothetical protein